MKSESLLPSNNILVSSNAENVNDIRPGGKGWKSSLDDQRKTVTITVGKSLQYGGKIKLLKSKDVQSYDVVLLGGKNSPQFKVSY